MHLFDILTVSHWRVSLKKLSKASMASRAVSTTLGCCLSDAEWPPIWNTLTKKLCLSSLPNDFEWRCPLTMGLISAENLYRVLLPHLVVFHLSRKAFLRTPLAHHKWAFPLPSWEQMEPAARHIVRRSAGTLELSFTEP